MEMIFIRLLHLLAHHPDFATSQEEMLDIAKYIQFYLSQVANADTISLLYHLAMKGKTVRDAESQQHTEVHAAHSFLIAIILIAGSLESVCDLRACAGAH
jgi:predicted membrane channel-forming protein YqfA (hemolysin III family)